MKFRVTQAACAKCGGTHPKVPVTATSKAPTPPDLTAAIKARRASAKRTVNPATNGGR